MARRSNRKGFDELNAHIAKLEKLAKLPRDAKPAMGRAVAADMKTNAASGKGPDGKAYRQSLDGRAVLRRAADAITVVVTTSAILITLTGRHARHHLGIVRGTGPRAERARPIIPTNEIPASTTKALKRAAASEFKRVMR